MSHFNHQSNPSPPPHVALLPSSGMGHLTPFLRLAASLSSHNVKVTLITPQTTVSLSESQNLSQFLSVYPQITHVHLHLLPMDTINSEDPFYLKYEAIRRSSHLLPPLLSSLTPRLSALITDMSLASTVIPVIKTLRLPNYILFSSSAKMLTFFASCHTILNSKVPEIVQIPGVGTIPRSWIPPPLLSENQNLLKTYIIDNGKSFIHSDGILINSCESIEGETLEALNNGSVVKGLPKVTAIGPFCPCNCGKRGSLQSVRWLDDQPAGSVLYISFGSKTAMSRDQIRELGDGLVRSGCKFLWVVKEKKVDREDKGELEEVFGIGFMEKVKGLGMMVKNWVNQEEVLGHKAIGGFVSHCGWNSVMEAAWFGVPVLAWPQHADQKMNASVVEKVGLGVWAEEWGWGGEMVVKSEKIEEKIREIMGNGLLKERAERVRENARRAVEDGGSSEKGLVEVIEMWKKSSVM